MRSVVFAICGKCFFTFINYVGCYSAPVLSFSWILLSKCRICSLISNMLEYAVAAFAYWTDSLFQLHTSYVLTAFYLNDIMCCLRKALPGKQLSSYQECVLCVADYFLYCKCVTSKCS